MSHVFFFQQAVDIRAFLSAKFCSDNRNDLAEVVEKIHVITLLLLAPTPDTSSDRCPETRAPSCFCGVGPFGVAPSLLIIRQKSLSWRIESLFACAIAAR